MFMFDVSHLTLVALSMFGCTYTYDLFQIIELSAKTSKLYVHGFVGSLSHVLQRQDRRRAQTTIPKRVLSLGIHDALLVPLQGHAS